MNTPIQNPFIIFETHLKNIHTLLSRNEVSQDNLPMLKDKETGELIVKVARNMEKELKDKTLFTISSGITSRVAREGKAILSTDAQSDERFFAHASVMDHNLRSLMCVPLKIKVELMGIIYADNRMVSGTFTEESIELLTTFANQAAISIENA